MSYWQTKSLNAEIKARQDCLMAKVGEETILILGGEGVDDDDIEKVYSDGIVLNVSTMQAERKIRDCKMELKSLRNLYCYAEESSVMATISTHFVRKIVKIDRNIN